MSLEMDADTAGASSFVELLAKAPHWLEIVNMFDRIYGADVGRKFLEDLYVLGYLRGCLDQSDSTIRRLDNE